MRSEIELNRDLNDVKVFIGSTNLDTSTQELSKTGGISRLNFGQSVLEIFGGHGSDPVYNKQDIDTLWNEVYPHLAMVDL